MSLGILVAAVIVISLLAGVALIFVGCLALAGKISGISHEEQARKKSTGISEWEI